MSSTRSSLVAPVVLSTALALLAASEPAAGLAGST
jgi:hypothetical protein